jgi:hypothetical protein
MGSRPWDYVTKWEPDLNAVVERAQRETLASGSFGGEWGKRELPPNPTIADVRAAYEYDGSGSVIDVLRLESEPGAEVAGPFSDEVLLDVFGTVKPTRAQAYERFYELLELLQRGETAYVVLFEGEKPNEVLFLGQTAD